MVNVSDTSKRQITTKKKDFFSHKWVGWVVVKEWQNNARQDGGRRRVPVKLKCVYLNMTSKFKNLILSEDSYNI